MDFLFILFQIFLIIFLGVYVVVGIFFLIRAYQTRLLHLIYGGIAFSLAGASQIISFLFNLPSMTETILLALAFILSVVFTNLVFYQKTTSRLPSVVMVLTLINALIYCIFNLLRVIADSELLYYITILHDIFFKFNVFGWLGWSSLSAYKQVKNQEIEPWIKARYKIISSVSFLICFERIVRIFQPWYQEFGDPNYLESYIVFGIISIMAIIFAVGFALAWFMPSWLKRFLNKGYQSVEDKEYTEEELMNLIKRELSNGGANGNN